MHLPRSISRWSRSHLLLGVVGAAIAGTVCPVRAGEEVRVDGVLHVRNPAQPPEGVETMRLEEIWRVDQDSELLLGLPTRVTYDAEGNVYVLDAQLNHVHVFSPAGKLLATLSREGDGPGEMRNPSDMMVTETGVVGIVQEYPGKVVRFDRGGNPLPSLHPGGAPERDGWSVLMCGCARADRWVVAGMVERRSEEGESTRNLFLSGFDDQGIRLATYVELREPDRARSEGMRERDFLHPFALAFDVAPDGRVFVPADWERYAIDVYNPDGSLERVIERSFEPWRRTPEDLQRLRSLIASDASAPPFAFDETAPTVALYQRGLQVTEDGELWLLTSRGMRDQPEGAFATYDVFDAHGHFRRQVRVHCAGDPWNDCLLFLPNEHVVRVRRFVDAFITSLGPGSLPAADDADGEATPAVICYRVTR